MGANDVGEHLDSAIADVIRLERELAVVAGERDRARSVAVHLEQAADSVSAVVERLRGKFGQWRGMYDGQGHPLMAVAGYCPMGCGETLETFERGIRCSAPECADPAAVSKVLADPETEHIVVLTAENFHMQHPLRERLEGELFTCPLFQHLLQLDGPPVPVGRYQVKRSADGEWHFDEAAS
jgi:hypothetical protein